jgi:hypothetical protein
LNGDHMSALTCTGSIGRSSPCNAELLFHNDIKIVHFEIRRAVSCGGMVVSLRGHISTCDHASRGNRTSGRRPVVVPHFFARMTSFVSSILMFVNPSHQRHWTCKKSDNCVMAIILNGGSNT